MWRRFSAAVNWSQSQAVSRHESNSALAVANMSACRRIPRARPSQTWLGAAADLSGHCARTARCMHAAASAQHGDCQPRGSTRQTPAPGRLPAQTAAHILLRRGGARSGAPALRRPRRPAGRRQSRARQPLGYWVGRAPGSAPAARARARAARPRARPPWRRCRGARSARCPSPGPWAPAPRAAARPGAARPRCCQARLAAPSTGMLFHQDKALDAFASQSGRLRALGPPAACAEALL